MYIAVIVILFLAVIIVGNVLPMCFMKPVASGKIEGTDITAVKNRNNNLFLIPAGENWIAIDAGSDAAQIKRDLEALSIDKEKIAGVFITHTDFDHVASVPLFSHAAIYMSEQEKQMIDGSTARQFLKKNKIPGLSDLNQIRYMKDQETVELCGRRIRMISAPGHTKGSAMFAVDEKYLFSGDVLKAVKGRISVHPYTMDKKQAQETIYDIKEELKKYEKVFTAHYGPLAEAAE